MLQSIIPPPSFCPSTTNASVDWELWKESFEAYMAAIDGEDFTYKKKYALLRHCLGLDGRKIL